VTGAPGVPSAEELSALPAAELAVRLAGAYRLIADLTAQAGRLSAQVERLLARVEELERQARKDSSTSSRPPSSDSPYRKKGGDRSLRERGKRRPGKQPGDPGSTMSLVDDPDERIDCPPATCCGCGADLAGAPVTAQRLERVEGSAPLLGGEPERYYELAAADAAAEPGKIKPAAFGGGVVRSVPLLPAAPAGSDGDEAHEMVRIMCEDIATTHLDNRTETDRLQVLAAIDSLPVGHRTDLGRFLLDGLHAARLTDPEAVSWKMRTFRSTGGEPQLGFGVCSKFTELTRQAFISWLLLRHHERRDLRTIADAVSIGVLLTPRGDGFRDWDTTMAAVTGELELTEEELRQSRELWNREH
jgi:Family of unknown function (DUF6444)